MTKIALTAAAILVATGTAFAGSDHYRSRNAYNAYQPSSHVNVDNTPTGSIRKSVPAEHNAANTRVRTQSDNTRVRTQSDVAEPGQGIWGR